MSVKLAAIVHAPAAAALRVNAAAAKQSGSGKSPMKKFLLGLIAVILLTVTAGIYLWNNLDGVLQTIIQSHGSKVLTTELTVAEIRTDRQRGRGSIAGIKVANPPGFSDTNIIQLGKITFRINTEKTAINPIILNEVVIRGADAVYEINDAGISNVDTLKRQIHAQRYRKSEHSSPLKFIIRKLIVETSMARLRTPATGKGPKRIRLPKIMMHNVGVSSEGVTAGEIMRQLTSRILGNMSNAVAGTGQQMPGRSPSE